MVESDSPVDDPDSWQCETCTFLNAAAEAPNACAVCETPRPRHKKREPWACPSCTLVNEAKTKYCLACDTRRLRGNKKRRHGQAEEEREGSGGIVVFDSNAPAPRKKQQPEQEDDDSHLAARERFVTSVLFPQFVEEVEGEGGKKRCLVCGKVHSTAGIMRAHFVRTHLGAFGQDLTAGNAAAMAALRLQADERLAVALAGEGEDGKEEDREPPQQRRRPAPEEESPRAAVTSSAASSAARAQRPPPRRPEQQRRRRRRRMLEDEDEEYDGRSDEEEDGEEAGPTTRSGRTLVYGGAVAAAAALQRHAVLRETMREMEVRKQRRLEMLVERTTALLGRLKRDIDALVGTGGGGEGGGVGTEEGASSIRLRRVQGVELRDYQGLGVRWLMSLHAHGLNGILADEMGLGKTLQTLAFLCLLQERTGIWGPHLVVAPLSVLSNWHDELARVVAGARVHVYHGQKEERKEAFNQAVKGWRRGGEDGEQGPVIVLTTYEMVLIDTAVLRLGGSRGLEWTYLVVDEAHRLKNRHGKLLAAMQSLRARHRLLLTGTPLQNDLSELFSLLSFVQPSLFKRVHTLQDWFDQPFETGGAEQEEKELREVQLTKEEEDVVIGQLHTVLRPFLLRRTKAQVLASLPEKEERVVRCPISALQVRLYHLLQDGCQAAAAAYKGKKGGALASTYTRQPLSTANLLMQLRKLCCHPFLLLRDLLEWDDLEPLLVPACGKLLVLARILARLKALGRRVLIFSQLTSVLDLLEAFMDAQGHEYLRLDGGTKAEERPGLIEAFNAPDSPVFAFLISTRAGGLGLNLQSADTVIIYDSDFNPQNDLQAQARVHRIGQTNDVLVLRLVSVGPDPGSSSVEEHVLAIAQTKLERERRIIETGKFTLGSEKGEGADEESEEVNARAELQSFLELQCVQRASRATAPAAAAASEAATDDSLDGNSGLQLQLLERERLDALAARNDADLARLQQLSLDDASDALMDAAHLPTWLARLEEEMLGGGSGKEAEWGVLGPDAKRRRVARFDSLSDVAIYRQRLQEGAEEEEEDDEVDGSNGSHARAHKGAKKKQGGAGHASASAPAPLAAAPTDAACVKCLVEGRLDEKAPSTGEEEQAMVLCPECANPYHRGCLGKEGMCDFCQAEG